jgi:hypothetical protein
MNLEDLNKSQLLLLTILVNFITSIATGILTVSLLDEAPPIVSQTVNRIVEQTVAAATPPDVITKQTTVVDKQQDLVVAAVAADAARTVGIYGPEGTSTPLIAIGTYLPKARAVATAGNPTLPAQAVIAFANGASAAVSLANSNADVAIYGFADSATLPALASPALLPLSSLAQGETALALAADGSALTGIISRITDKDVYTTLGTTPAGAAAVDLDGDIIGISDGAGAYVSAAEITAALVPAAPATTP